MEWSVQSLVLGAAPFVALAGAGGGPMWGSHSLLQRVMARTGAKPRWRQPEREANSAGIHVSHRGSREELNSASGDGGLRPDFRERAASEGAELDRVDMGTREKKPGDGGPVTAGPEWEVGQVLGSST